MDNLMEEYNLRQLTKTDRDTIFAILKHIYVDRVTSACVSFIIITLSLLPKNCFKRAKKLMCSMRFSRKPSMYDKREKQQKIMTKPSQ